MGKSRSTKARQLSSRSPKAPRGFRRRTSRLSSRFGRAALSAGSPGFFCPPSNSFPRSPASALSAYLLALAPRYLPDERNLFFTVGLPVGVKDLVVPDRRLMIDIRVLPGIPRIIGLRFSRNQSPIDCRYLVFLCDWQDALERAAGAAGHIFGAQDRPVELLQKHHMLREIVGLGVIVERENVRQFQLNFLHGAEFSQTSPIAFP